MLHRCDNPPCVRPEHLFIGTDGDNVKDRQGKGRTAHGETHYMAKLSDADVADIRSRYGPLHRHLGNGKRLAEEYGVSKSTISVIVNRKSRWM